MPITTCKSNGKPGFRACPSCTCYTYTEGNEESRNRALAKAKQQLKAIKTNGKN